MELANKQDQWLAGRPARQWRRLPHLLINLAWLTCLYPLYYQYPYGDPVEAGSQRRLPFSLPPHRPQESLQRCITRLTCIKKGCFVSLKGGWQDIYHCEQLAQGTAGQTGNGVRSSSPALAASHRAGPIYSVGCHNGCTSHLRWMLVAGAAGCRSLDREKDKRTRCRPSSHLQLPVLHLLSTSLGLHLAFPPPRLKINPPHGNRGYRVKRTVLIVVRCKITCMAP